MNNTATKLNNIDWFRDRLLAWAEQNLRDYPWRNTDNSYHILVAECLLQRTDADTVTPVYKTLLIQYPTLKELAIADVKDIAEILQPLGLFFRAERLSQTAKTIIEQHQEKIPNSQTELLKLPGIGIYTARAILSQAFKQSAAVMDTNVARILERFFGIKGERVKSRCKILWGAADTIAPRFEVGRWNLTLLDFGALICTARKPKCSQCPLAAKCHWFDLNNDIFDRN